MRKFVIIGALIFSHLFAAIWGAIFSKSYQQKNNLVTINPSGGIRVVNYKNQDIVIVPCKEGGKFKRSEVITVLNAESHHNGGNKK